MSLLMFAIIAAIRGIARWIVTSTVQNMHRKQAMRGVHSPGAGYMRQKQRSMH